MNEYASTMYKKTARWTILACGLLFSLFSFIFLYVFQCDVLEALHYSLAHGKTVFAPMASAIVITVTLILLRWGVNSLIGLKGKVRSLSYLPSFLVLCALTDVGRDVYMSSYHSSWLWLLPLLIMLFICSAYWLRKKFRQELNEEGSLSSLIFWNLLFLIAQCFLTVSLSNTNRTFHHELQMEHALRHKNYQKALQIGYRSLDPSRTETVLRSIALARSGQMGDKLFHYPQYYRSDGLFFANDSTRQLRYTNDSIYVFLGVRPYTGEPWRKFLHNICYKETGRYAALPYYLSFLLLEKDLDRFAKEIPVFYEENDTLPVHFREAMLLYQTERADTSLWNVKDSAMIGRFQDFKRIQSEEKKETPRINRLRRAFGDTYWWYYYCQN